MGKRIRQGTFIGLTFFSAVIAVPIFFLATHTLSHNWQLAKIARSMKALQHPKSTFMVKQVGDVGLLIGNGNHCDYFVG